MSLPGLANADTSVCSCSVLLIFISMLTNLLKEKLAKEEVEIGAKSEWRFEVGFEDTATVKVCAILISLKC